MDLQDIVALALVLLAFLIKALASGKKKNPQTSRTQRVAAHSRLAAPEKKVKASIKPHVVPAETSSLRKPSSLPKAHSGSITRKKAPFFKDKNELKKAFIFQEIVKKHPESF